MQLQSSINGALAAGILAGVFDIGMAALINEVSPIIVLKAIASGLLGKAAFSGDAAIMALGFALQIAMSVVIAAIYVTAAQRLPQLLTHPLRFGAAYGVAVFIVMNGVVVPLSAFPRLPQVTPYWVFANLSAMLVFGVLIAIVERAFR